MKYRIVAVVLLVVSLVGARGTAMQAPTYPTIPHLTNVNAEVLRLVIADQWDRDFDMFGHAKNSAPFDWRAISQRDLEREAAVHRLLKSGALRTGKDDYFAALVLQHSHVPDDVLLAHVLSVTAASRGEQFGLWLAAASLDRYLMDIGKPQVFGTQTFTGPHPTQDPFNRTALTPAERELWNVH